MKYIKKFETFNNRQPQIGDYVICVDKSKTNPNRKDKILFDEFIKTHPGKIIKTSETHEFFVQYSPIPEDLDILKYAFYTTDRTIIKGLKYEEIKIDKTIYSNITSVKREEIIFFSDDIEIAESYIETNKDLSKFNI